MACQVSSLSMDSLISKLNFSVGVAAANGGVIPGPNRFSLEFGSHSVSTLSCFFCAFLNLLPFGINCPRLEVSLVAAEVRLKIAEYYKTLDLNKYVIL